MKAALFCVLAAVVSASAKTAKPTAAKRGEVKPEPFSVSTAAPSNVAELVSHFQEIDQRLTSLSARFTQSLSMKDAGMAQSVQGSLEYAKPNRLRVEHSKPNRQLFVSDGVKVWVHRLDQNQVIESSLADWRKSDPLFNNLLDFGNYSRLLEAYDVSLDTAAMRVLLRPKAKTEQPFTLKLKLSGPYFFPMETELDLGATQVRTVLSDVRFNPAIPRARFEFSAPPGAEVFQNFKFNPQNLQK